MDGRSCSDDDKKVWSVFVVFLRPSIFIIEDSSVI